MTQVRVGTTDNSNPKGNKKQIYRSIHICRGMLHSVSSTGVTPKSLLSFPLISGWSETSPICCYLYCNSVASQLVRRLTQLAAHGLSASGSQGVLLCSEYHFPSPLCIWNTASLLLKHICQCGEYLRYADLKANRIKQLSSPSQFYGLNAEA
jgi:hypothetical protein